MAGIVTAAATMAAAVVAAVVTLTTVYHPPSSSHDTNTGQSQTSCAVVAEDYYLDIKRNPGIVKALIVVVSADPDARRCGINATTIELMKEGTSP